MKERVAASGEIEREQHETKGDARWDESTWYVEVTRELVGRSEAAYAPSEFVTAKRWNG